MAFIRTETEHFHARFAETGEALVSSVDKIIFVGSPGVGKMVCCSIFQLNILVIIPFDEC